MNVVNISCLPKNPGYAPDSIREIVVDSPINMPVRITLAISTVSTFPDGEVVCGDFPTNTSFIKSMKFMSYTPKDGAVARPIE